MSGVVDPDIIEPETLDGVDDTDAPEGDPSIADLLAEGEGAPETAAPAAPVAPEPTTPEAVPAAEVAPEPVAAAPEVPPTPFSFRAFKQDYQVPGTRFDAATNTIVCESPQALDRLKQFMASGREWEARGRQELVQAKRDVEAVRQTQSAEQTQAATFLEAIQQVMSIDDPEEYLRAMLEFKHQMPVMQANARASYAERMAEQARTAALPPEPDIHTIAEEARTGARAVVEQMLANQPWATPDVVQKAVAMATDDRALDQFVGRALKDMPEQGFRAGQYVADWDRLAQMVEQFATPYRDAHATYSQRQHAAAVSVQSTQDAAKRNAAALAQATPARAARPSARPAPAQPPALPPRETNGQFMARLKRETEQIGREVFR